MRSIRGKTYLVKLMAIVEQVDHHEVVNALPDFAVVERGVTYDDVDLVVTALGFEEATAASIRSAINARVSRIAAIRYRTNPRENLQLCDASGSDVEISVHTYGDQYFLDTFSRLLGEYSDKKVLLDVTGMSSYLITCILNIACRKSDVRLSVSCTYPAKLGPDEETAQKVLGTIDEAASPEEVAIAYLQSTHRFESRGVDHVYESEFHAGGRAAGLPLKVLVIPSFGIERVRSMIEFCREEMSARVDVVEWLIASRANEVWKRAVLKRCFVGEHDQVSTVDNRYQDTMNVLFPAWSRVHCSRHLAICNCGGKMQTIAVTLFAMARPDVSVVLSEPKEFVANKFSEGVGETTCADFGSSRELLERLQTVGDLRFRWS